MMRARDAGLGKTRYTVIVELIRTEMMVTRVTKIMKTGYIGVTEI